MMTQVAAAAPNAATDPTDPQFRSFLAQIKDSSSFWEQHNPQEVTGTSISGPITAREREVLAMISQGLTNKRIARTLEISPETVKSHVKNSFLKLAVSTRAEAVFRAGSLGLL